MFSEAIPTPCLRGLFCVALLVLPLVSGCRSVPQPRPLSAEDPRPAQLLQQLASASDVLRSFEAYVKLAVDGQSGEQRSKLWMAAERPANLYVEVFGLLRQVMAVLVTDGARYSLQRSDGTPGEAGVVHPALLWETALIPLPPDEAVAVLLGTPHISANARLRNAASTEDEGLVLEVEEPAALGRDHSSYSRLVFDAEGRLRHLQHFGDSPQPDWEVRYADWKPVDGVPFAHSLSIDFAPTETRVRVSYRDVVLNPTFPAEFFAVESSPQVVDRGSAK